jgi:hypothetical protein
MKIEIKLTRANIEYAAEVAGDFRDEIAAQVHVVYSGAEEEAAVQAGPTILRVAGDVEDALRGVFDAMCDLERGEMESAERKFHEAHRSFSKAVRSLYGYRGEITLPHENALLAEVLREAA